MRRSNESVESPSDIRPAIIFFDDLFQLVAPQSVFMLSNIPPQGWMDGLIDGKGERTRLPSPLSRWTSSAEKRRSEHRLLFADSGEDNRVQMIDISADHRSTEEQGGISRGIPSGTVNSTSPSVGRLARRRGRMSGVRERQTCLITNRSKGRQRAESLSCYLAAR